MMGWSVDASGWLWMAIWIVALVAMVWLLIRPAGGLSSADEALSILRARFARGEISEEEFERARATLVADAPRR